MLVQVGNWDIKPNQIEKIEKDNFNISLEKISTDFHILRAPKKGLFLAEIDLQEQLSSVFSASDMSNEKQSNFLEKKKKRNLRKRKREESERSIVEENILSDEVIFFFFIAKTRIIFNFRYGLRDCNSEIWSILS